MARNTLNTLIRLTGAAVDAARQALQAVLVVEDRIHADQAQLEQDIRREEALVAADPDLAGPFALFMIRARERREALKIELEELQPKIEAARDALADAFANQKKYEIAKQNQEEAALSEANRREGIMLDEMGLNAHRRKSS